MAYTSEIEKLEARYRENPKGRNFAPLADAYRKAGLVDNAIELCQAGLQIHPDYVSGHIVHGRCLVDKKDDTGADAVFRRVLELDPENILALRVLAEIAERTDRYDAAVEWLDRLLMADPMNGEAAEGLSRVRAKATAQAARPIAPPEEPVATMLMDQDAAPLEVVHEGVDVEATTVPIEPAPADSALDLERLEGPFEDSLAAAPTAAMARPEFELERTSEPVSPPAAPPGDIEVFDGSLDFAAVAPDAAPPDGIQLEEPEVAEPDPGVQIEGLARTHFEASGMFHVEGELPAEQAPEPAVSEPDAGADRATSPMSDLPLIMPEDVEPEPRHEPLPELQPEPEPEPEPVGVAPAPPPIPRLPDDDGAADTETLSQAEPVVTETMAELYLRQGHREDARRVYEALSAQRPNDLRLQQKVSELSATPPVARHGGQSAGAFLKGILQARPGAPAPVLPPAPPLASDLAAERPNGAAQPPAPTPGSPTRPASDAISLDSVFGEEGSRHASAPSPEGSAEPSTKLPVASGGFSFDDFFGTSAAPGSSGNENAASRAPRHSGRGRVTEQEEDLDQFQAWLKSLKA